MELANLQRHWDALGQVDPLWAILSDDAMRNGKWDLADFLRTGELRIAEALAYAQSLNGNLATERALDFGCGVGRLTQALSGRFSWSYGVDIAPSMIELARIINRDPGRCFYYLNDTSDLHLFPDDTFDFIISEIVLQHMAPRYSKRYIAEFIRTLRPGGLALFQLPSDVLPIEDRVDGETTATDGPLPAGAARAGISVLNLTSPAARPPGTQTLLRVLVRHRGDAPWPALGDGSGRYQVKLGHRWFSENGALVGDEGPRTLLPHDIAPAGACELPLLVSVPSQSGRYELEVDMMQEGSQWFGETGSDAARLTVEVQAAGPDSAAGQPIAEPEIQMHTVPKPTVIATVIDSGGTVVDLTVDPYGGDRWRSYAYAVTKPSRIRGTTTSGPERRRPA